MNIKKALDAKYEHYTLNALLSAPVTALEGIGPAAAKVLDEILGIRNIETMRYFNLKLRRLPADKLELVCKAFDVENRAQLVSKPFVGIARAICELSKYERINIAAALDKEYENKRFNDLLKAPIEAIEGIGKSSAEVITKHTGAKTIEELGYIFIDNLKAEDKKALIEYFKLEDEEALEDFFIFEIARSIVSLAKVEE
ncbi:MAG: hypothetical protein NZ455_06720 [Bacteroidia bacterium]|nr:hypothetical protein [Bacteroidia bacterium]MDW8346040.1 hypothetical protein [Bacteroidia bacterium]